MLGCVRPLTKIISYSPLEWGAQSRHLQPLWHGQLRRGQGGQEFPSRLTKSNHHYHDTLDIVISRFDHQPRCHLDRRRTKRNHRLCPHQGFLLVDSIQQTNIHLVRLIINCFSLICTEAGWNPTKFWRLLIVIYLYCGLTDATLELQAPTAVLSGYINIQTSYPPHT